MSQKLSIDIEDKTMNLFTNNDKNHTNDDFIPFWYEDPNILFHKDYIVEFFPLNGMTPHQKLNALSRSIIFLTLLIFIFTRSLALVGVSVITLISIYIMYSNSKEGFSATTTQPNPTTDYLKQANISIKNDIFNKPTSKNPFSNVLVTDSVKRKPAPPIDSSQVKIDILTQAKQLVQDAHPGQPNIAEKLFKDLNEELNFEQSLRPFYSNPNTSTPNDQGAFAEFCYGSMTSCKEGNVFACAKNLSNHQNI